MKKIVLSLVLALLSLFVNPSSAFSQTAQGSKQKAPRKHSPPSPTEKVFDQLAEEFEAWQTLTKQRASARLVSDKETLQGLSEVVVLVEHIPAEIERDGLTEKQITVDVELRLRRAGIRVVPLDVSVSIKGKAMLYVNTNIIKAGPDDEMYVYSTTVSLEQDVWLARGVSPVLARGTTWRSGEVGMLGSQRLQSVRESIADRVDTFINDFLAANQR